MKTLSCQVKRKKSLCSSLPFIFCHYARASIVGGWQCLLTGLCHERNGVSNQVEIDGLSNQAYNKEHLQALRYASVLQAMRTSYDNTRGGEDYIISWIMNRPEIWHAAKWRPNDEDWNTEVLLAKMVCREYGHFVYVPSQWETTLHCNVVSHWLSTYRKWSLRGANFYLVYGDG